MVGSREIRRISLADGINGAGCRDYLVYIIQEIYSGRLLLYGVSKFRLSGVAETKLNVNYQNRGDVYKF